MSDHDNMTPEEMAVHIAEDHPGMTPMVLAVEPWVIAVVNRLMEEGDLDIAPDILGAAVFIFADTPHPVVIYNEAAGNPELTGVHLAIGAADEASMQLHARIIAIIDELTAKLQARVDTELDQVLNQIVNPDS